MEGGNLMKRVNTRGKLSGAAGTNMSRTRRNSSERLQSSGVIYLGGSKSFEVGCRNGVVSVRGDPFFGGQIRNNKTWGKLVDVQIGQTG